ncbi:hypothetical protein KGV52_01430 [Candidatus Gracilibacteria bacterium]|nr:hypothetical protein [Candidatus Gracilibacteria bacterium]
MPNYKISVSKDGKRYNILFKAETEALARERVHQDGYSILSLQEVSGEQQVGHTFIFEGMNKKGEFKHGKIAGNDILKAYIKLRKNLEYNILNIYAEVDKDKSDAYKKNILRELEEEYELFYKGGKKEKIDELRDKLNQDKIQKQQQEQFHLKKELLEATKLIDSVLKKIELIVTGESKVKVSIEQREKLQNIYRTLIKLKKSTNIAKLKAVGEKALTKIGELELQKLESSKDEESRKLLNETNKLLREIGSKEHFIEKDKDIKYQAEQFFKNIKKYFDKEERAKRKKQIEVDKNSHSYMKTLLYLRKYKEKKKENTMYIFSHLGKFLKDKELRDMTLLKRSVINQNILLLNAKVKGKVYSYTFMRKGFTRIIDSIFGIFSILKEYLFAVIVIYTFCFLVYLNITNYSFITEYNYNGLFLFLLLFTLYILLSLSKKFIFLVSSFVIFSFIIIFGVINF